MSSLLCWTMMDELNMRHKHSEVDRERENRGNYQSRQQIGAFKKAHSYEDVWQHFSASD